MLNYVVFQHETEENKNFMLFVSKLKIVCKRYSICDSTITDTIHVLKHLLMINDVREIVYYFEFFGNSFTYAII